MVDVQLALEYAELECAASVVVGYGDGAGADRVGARHGGAAGRIGAGFGVDRSKEEECLRRRFVLVVCEVDCQVRRVIVLPCRESGGVVKAACMIWCTCDHVVKCNRPFVARIIVSDHEACRYDNSAGL